MRAGGDVGGRRPVAGIGLDLVGAGGSALAVLRALTGAAGAGMLRAWAFVWCLGTGLRPR